MFRGGIFWGRKMSTFKKYIITDPSYIKTSQDYSQSITLDMIGTSLYKTPFNYVSLTCTNKIENSHKSLFINDDEQIILMPANAAAVKIEFSEYTYLGSHTSDSGLTCVIDSEKQIDEELDWLELVTTSLNEQPIDLEMFPMLEFCSTIPENDSSVAVYGRKVASETEMYDSIILRAWSRAFKE